MAKKNRSNPADPEGSIVVRVFNMKTKKSYSQNFKRKNLIDKKVIFTDEFDNRVVGTIFGFDSTTGAIMVEQHDGKMPQAGTDILVVLGA